MSEKTLKNLTNQVVSFRDARDWKQFHNPKDMALSLMLEAAELGELFQWVNESQLDACVEEKRKELSHELADVLYWVLLLANDLDINLEEAFEEKMGLNDSKYPIGTAKGSAKKYSEL